MRADRLLKLADYLGSVPPELFDMAHWAQRRDCGTVCCAMGHACAIPEFAAAGLRLDWFGSEPDETNATAQLSHYGGADAWPEVRNSFRAVARFFDISTDDAQEMFNAEYYRDCAREVTAADVAARIRAFVSAAQPVTA